MAFMRRPVRTRLAPPKPRESMMSSTSLKLYIIRVAACIRYAFRMVSAIFFCCLPFYLIFFHGISHGFHIGALIWSFFVLCLPWSLASSVFSFPFWLSSGKTLRYAEIISWIAALILNIHSYYTTPHIYLKGHGQYITLGTPYLLYRIISNPWPYWLIILSCTITMLFRTFARDIIKKKSSFQYYVISIGLTLLSLILLFKLTYQEWIIIFNIQA
jgi:hypothetical protein